MLKKLKNLETQNFAFMLLLHQNTALKLWRKIIKMQKPFYKKSPKMLFQMLLRQVDKAFLGEKNDGLAFKKM